MTKKTWEIPNNIILWPNQVVWVNAAWDRFEAKDLNTWTWDQKDFWWWIVIIPTIINNWDWSITLWTDWVINFFTTANWDSIPVRKNMTTGATLTMTDNAINYVYADYNSWTPIYAVSTNAIQFFTDWTKQPVVRIVRYWTKLHTEDYDEYWLALSNKILFKNTTLAWFQRESWLVLSTSATRISTISSGSAWLWVRYRDNTSLVENKSWTSWTLEEWYLVAWVWNRSVVTSYDSSYYSDWTNRQTLWVAKYVAKYFFRDIWDDNEVYYIHWNQHNLRADAINEPLPQVSPLISSHSLYVGKIVIQQGATNWTAYNRDWGTSLENAVVTDHENLSNILQAGLWVTNWHISAWAQTIEWLKTLLEWIKLEKEAIIKEIATPTNPTSWYYKLYFKSDWKFYKLDSAWVESEVWWWAWLTWGASISWSSWIWLSLTASSWATWWISTTISNSSAAPTNAWNYSILWNTQSVAHIMQTIDTWTSAQRHTGLLIKLINWSNTSKWINIDLWSTWTWYWIYFSSSSANWMWWHLCSWIYFDSLHSSSSNNQIKYWIYQYRISNWFSSSSWYWLYQLTIRAAWTWYWTYQWTIRTWWATWYWLYQWTICVTWTWYWWYVNNLNSNASNITSKFFSLNWAISNPLTWRILDLSEIITSRTNTSTSWTISDNFNQLNIKRTSIQNWTWWTFVTTWSVLKLENVATQTAWTLTDTVSVLTLTQWVNTTWSLITMVSWNTNSRAIDFATNLTTATAPTWASTYINVKINWVAHRILAQAV